MPRSFSWNAALASLKADRTPVPRGLAGSRYLVGVYAQTQRRPLVVAGKFDRSAIMAMAALAAKRHQGQYGTTWAEAMSVCLKAAWQAAHLARTAAKH